MSKAHATLTFVAQNHTFRLPLTKVITVLGAAADADLRLDLPEVSRRHLRITCEGKGKYSVEDLQSVMGTFLRRGDMQESRLDAPTALLPLDTLRIGDYTLHFNVDPDTSERFFHAVRFDQQRAAVVEIPADDASMLSQPRSTQLRRWRAALKDTAHRLREPDGQRALKVAAAAIGAVLLLLPYNMNVNCECRLIAGAMQKVRAPMSGRIDRVFVSEGAHVRKDEVILRVVDRATQTEKTLADKELSAAREALKQASARDRRKRMPAIKARLRAAELRSEKADALLDQADVRAGIAGRVMTATPETLENTVVSSGQEVLELAETSRVVVEALVPELDIDDIVIGQRLRANFYTDMATDHDTHVQSIVPVAERGPLGAFIVVKAAIDNPEERLIPGTTGVAKIVGRRQMGIVLLAKRIGRLFR